MLSTINKAIPTTTCWLATCTRWWRLQGPGHDRLRLPCFVSEPGQSILPAFGAFTGGHVLNAAPGRQRHVVGVERVWTLPPC